MELNVCFSALEMMLAMLKYRKVCARWVSWMLTQEHKGHGMQVCQDLLNNYEAEGDSFLDRIIPMMRRDVTTTSRNQNGSP
jgi:hypothetical protein